MAARAFSNVHEQRDVMQGVEVAVQIGNIIGDIRHLRVEELKFLLVQCTYIIQCRGDSFMIEESA